jgi:asparagine synthase (glutamine-hydrolysing)
MCGIVGIFHVNESANLSDEGRVLAEMLEQISARGPNGRGVWHDRNIHLGHCRLSIIDLSELSSQPLRLENDQSVIVFNGEIFNYKQLKKRLEDLGDKFFSNGDTEVVIRGFNRFGIDWFKELNGMFATAIWSKSKRELVLVRDRFGIKPLYWTIVDGTLLFSSQIKSFQRYPSFASRFNLRWLNEYLTFQDTHGSITPFEGTYLLEPGHAIVFRDGDMSPEHIVWAKPRQYRPDYSISPEAATEVVTDLFSKAVKNSLVSDVPVGSYLSGGIDSGAVVTIAAQFEPALHTFTCGFDATGLASATRAMNETNDALELSKLLGTQYHDATISPSEIAPMHARVLRTIEEPRVGVLYQNDVAAKLASSWVRVCLNGAGGDELFGGYPWRYKTMRHAENRDDFLCGYFGFWQRLFCVEEKQQLFKPYLLKILDLTEPYHTFERQFPENANYTDIGYKTWFCLKYESEFFLHGLLQIGDRLAGAYGLEERFPFLDQHLISFLDTIPAEYHWDPDEQPTRDGDFSSGKRLLRKALSRLVPGTISNRRKQGFVIPAKEWFDGPLSDFVSTQLASENTRITEFLEPRFLQDVIADEKKNSQFSRSTRLWSLLSVESLLRTFFD